MAKVQAEVTSIVSDSCLRMGSKEKNTITEERYRQIQNLKALNIDEAALYDRQIRLWGLESQQRIRNANILIAGIKGLGNEICKNLVLAGIGSLTILDHEPVTVQDLGAQFFLTDSDIGKNRAEAAAVQVQALNPRVVVKTDTGDIETKPDTFFDQFDIVCITNASKPTLVRRTANGSDKTPSVLHLLWRLQQQVRLDVICRSNKTPFYAADTFGMFGYIFCDLHSHNYIQVRKEEPTTKNGTPREISEARVEEYCTLVESLERDWSDIKKAQLKKRVSKAYPMTLLRYRFQELHGHLPSSKDEAELWNLRNVYLPQLGFTDLSFLDDSMIEQVSPPASVYSIMQHN
ncbi:E1 ubiquitin-activating protein aos1 [Umbelopsis nana]